MKVAITGAEGFVGRWAAKRLAQEGYSIRTLDRKSENLSVPATLRDFVEDASTVIHIAGRNRASEAELYASNTVSTIGLLRAVEAFGSHRTHLLYASSVQVYEPTESLELLGENHETRPSNAFAGSKLLAEDILRKWSDSGAINVTVMRISNVYGPGCRPYYNSVVATFVDRAQKGQVLEVSGSGRQTRDFLFISDLADAIAALTESKLIGFHVFNVSTGRGTSVLSVAQKIQHLLPATRVRVDSPTSDDESYVVADPTKLEQEVGFTPKVAFDQGLGMTLGL